MKSKQALYLSLPTPCDQSWNEMRPVSGGRHCSSCSKTIIDFSLLTDVEIFAAIHNSKGTVCGRFSDDQLNRSITMPVPPRHSFVPAMIMTAGLAVGIATASHAETRGLEQIEMNIVPTPLADTSIEARSYGLPEVVVVAYGIKKRTYTAGVVCVTTKEIKPLVQPLAAQPITSKEESVPGNKKRKKRFLFF